MSDIKKGALVKCWDTGQPSFYIGRYVCKERSGRSHLVGYTWYENAIELPPELAKQLEELGR